MVGGGKHQLDPLLSATNEVIASFSLIQASIAYVSES